MSGMALIWAANVKGLKPAAKIVLIQLADFHNKETGQCNPSAQRLADECEMGRATLFRHMTTLEECGLVTRHARGDGDGGRGSNQYELHLDITLGPSARPKGGGRVGNGVVSQNETGGNVSKKRGKSLKGETGVVSNRDRNLTIEPVKEPPSRKREAGEAEKILAAYPPDRLRGKAACLAQIEEAIKEGIDPEDLLRAVQAYLRFIRRSRGQSVMMKEELGTPEFAEHYSQLLKGREPTPTKRNFEALILSYFESNAYKKLKPRTKADYRKYIGHIRVIWRTKDPQKIETHHIYELHRANAEHWRQANYLV